MLPETRYARQGGLHLAYQVLGEGPPDLLLLDQWFSHMEAQWDVPPVAEFRERLASFGRLIMYDKRGSGLSDPIPTSDLPTIEEWMDDVPIVLDAAGSDRAVVIAISVAAGWPPPTQQRTRSVSRASSSSTASRASPERPITHSGRRRRKSPGRSRRRMRPWAAA
jgi:hypothetical protein